MHIYAFYLHARIVQKESLNTVNEAKDGGPLLSELLPQQCENPS